jgi:hypothetical protein
MLSVDLSSTGVPPVLAPPSCEIPAMEKSKPKMVQSAAAQSAVVERVGMKRWLRLTARKHSVGKASINPAADAAATALEALLRDQRKHA